MCGNGTWNFAYRIKRYLRNDVIVEQCDLCDEYRERTASDLSFR